MRHFNTPVARILKTDQTYTCPTRLQICQIKATENKGVNGAGIYNIGAHYYHHHVMSIKDARTTTTL